MGIVRKIQVYYDSTHKSVVQMRLSMPLSDVLKVFFKLGYARVPSPQMIPLMAEIPHQLIW